MMVLHIVHPKSNTSAVHPMKHSRVNSTFPFRSEFIVCILSRNSFEISFDGLLVALLEFGRLPSYYTLSSRHNEGTKKQASHNPLLHNLTSGFSPMPPFPHSLVCSSSKYAYIHAFIQTYIHTWCYHSLVLLCSFAKKSIWIKFGNHLDTPLNHCLTLGRQHMT